MIDFQILGMIVVAIGVALFAFKVYIAYQVASDPFVDGGSLTLDSVALAPILMAAGAGLYNHNSSYEMEWWGIVAVWFALTVVAALFVKIVEWVAHRKGNLPPQGKSAH